MKLILGPMEGVLDAPMRELLTQINPFSLCVTEFVRVVDRKLPKRTFYKYCPELYQGGKTTSGTPVRVQLLGQSPEYLAENASLAAELGSHGIDINFGCPSKTVNGNKGGAALLKEPETIYHILRRVREALPKAQPLSAKIRLGFDDCSRYSEIADAVVQAGANELIVHGRSKADAYIKGTIRWDLIGEIKKDARINVIANGEIWNAKDAQQCRLITDCESLMLCRGVLSMPNLGRHILKDEMPYSWTQVLNIILQYSTFEIKGDEGLYYANRVKQWLRYLLLRYIEAKDVFFGIRCLNDKKDIVAALVRYQNQHSQTNANSISACSC